MTQGTIKINADKVVVTRPGGEQGKEIIDRLRHPATFYPDAGQRQAGERPRAKNCTMNCRMNFVVLTGNAHLEQIDSNIQGDKITYLGERGRKCKAFKQ